MNKYFSKVLDYIQKNKRFALLFLLVFTSYVFLRVFDLEKRAQFTWDQVDNAWHAKNLIVDGVYPLEGMPAKQNSGISIGPFYYYFVSFFYLVTDLDPIASPIVASTTSILAFFVLFFCSLKLFNKWIGLIAVFIVAFSNYLIIFDRIQWPVGFIPSIGILIFLSLYKISQKKYNYYFLLMLALGFSLHVHFTSIFYFLIILLFTLFIPRNIKSLKKFIYSMPLFLVWLLPFFVSITQRSGSMNLFSFLAENNVGLHLRRVLQVAEIAFAENAFILWGDLPIWFGLIILPVFIIFYLKKKNNKPLIYLAVIWILVPWVLLSMFKGDLTPYYFALSRFVSIGLLSYIIYTLIKFKPRFAIPAFLIASTLYMYLNISQFINYKSDGLSDLKKITYEKFERSAGNEFTYGSGETYLYYFYERKYYGEDYHNKD